MPSWYSSLLEQQAASGLSVYQFAERAGMSPWTLYEWRRRLSGSTDSGPEAAAPKLVEVAITRSEPVTVAWMVVRLGDGRRSITVPPGFDSDELRRLVAVLESC